MTTLAFYIDKLGMCTSAVRICSQVSGFNNFLLQSLLVLAKLAVLDGIFAITLKLKRLVIR